LNLTDLSSHYIMKFQKIWRVLLGFELSGTREVNRQALILNNIVFVPKPYVENILQTHSLWSTDILTFHALKANNFTKMNVIFMFLRFLIDNLKKSKGVTLLIFFKNRENYVLMKMKC